MKHLGDITKINGHNVPLVDIVTGGSPCQDLSVAGKRAGLAGKRSGLFMEQIRIIKEMRDESIKQLRLRGSDEHIRPRYMVWENVPGAFSSNKGEDFRAVLEETAKVVCEDAVIPRPEGGTGHQAAALWEMGGALLGEYMMRSFGEFPSAENVSLLSQILEETPHPKYCLSPKACQGILRRAKKRGKQLPKLLETTLIKQSAFKSEPENGGGKGILIQHERTGALSTLNNQPVCYGISSYDSNAMKSSNPHSGIYEAETTRTLDLNGGNPACNQGGMICLQRRFSFVNVSEDGITPTLEAGAGEGGNNMPMVVEGVDVYNQTTTGDVTMSVTGAATDSHHIPCVIEGNGSRPSHKGDGYKESETMYTLNTVEQHGVVYSMGHDIRSARFTDDEITDPLTATDYKDPIKINDNRKTYQNITGTLDCGITKGTGNQLANSNMFIANTSVVRRLTPMECERLQGYPDHWTDIGEWTDSKGKKHKDADSPRYKALGNSIALPFWEWMAKRIVKHLDKDHPTMASLFDGIGGFPLVYSRAGCKPIWASEIEEFPIAVTKIRFPEEAEV